MGEFRTSVKFTEAYPNMKFIFSTECHILEEIPQIEIFRNFYLSHFKYIVYIYVQSLP